jgi:hypothetical protein
MAAEEKLVLIPEGVLLKPAPAFTATRLADVFGYLPHRGRPKTMEEMLGQFELP